MLVLLDHELKLINSGWPHYVVGSFNSDTEKDPERGLIIHGTMMD